MNHTSHFASLVRDRRLDLGLTQQQAADRAGISEPSWRAIEAGQRQHVRDITARGICRALGWAPGSVASVLDGGQPAPTSDAVAPDELTKLRAVVEAQARVVELLAREAIERLGGRDEIGERLADLELLLGHRQAH